MMRSNLFSKGALAAVIAAPLVLIGCGGDSITGASPSEAGSTLVRVAHLSPDAPPVDVLVNGARVVNGAAFGDATGYLALPAGSARIQVVPAGASSPVVIDATLDLADGAAYTVAATGLLGANDLRPIVLVDDFGTRGDRAKVRFVHASPDAPAVDIAAAGGALVGGADPATLPSPGQAGSPQAPQTGAQSQILFANVAFRESRGYVPVAGGSYDLQVRPAGSTAVALTIPAVGLPNGRNFTIFAIGRLGNGSLTALALPDAR
jgi:hypothetical protein